MSLIKIRLGGVPEHFNLPIHLAIENGKFREKGIEIEWTTFKGGTGQMTKALAEDRVDICILLTEGIVQSIIKGNPSKIISVYVKSPLIWGIHSGAKNSLQHYRDIFDKKYAISRKGSGSHLMAIVDANAKNREISEDQWVIVNNLDGALLSLQNLESDVFYWEKFTTKPYVDKGILKRVGEFLTPWPCFVIAATDKLIAEKKEAIDQVLEVIHAANSDFMKNDSATQEVSLRYSIDKKDAEDWYHNTEWATHGWVSNKILESVCYYLEKAGIIDKKADRDRLIWKR